MAPALVSCVLISTQSLDACLAISGPHSKWSETRVSSMAVVGGESPFSLKLSEGLSRDTERNVTIVEFTHTLAFIPYAHT